MSLQYFVSLHSQVFIPAWIPFVPQNKKVNFIRIPFVPQSKKVNFIKTLVHRALMICSKSKLNDEIMFISMTLCSNGFPWNVVQTVIKNKIIDFNKIKFVSV